MKLYITIVLIFVFGFNIAQNQTKAEREVKLTIDTFFDGFHKQDSIIINTVVHKSIILQSIGNNAEGDVVLSNSKFYDFIKSIVSIPKDQSFEEKLLSYTIKMDGNMANVWTEYEFWFNQKFSHCGVNSFQLIKENGKWKIFFLADTRRKDGCGKE